MTEIPRLGSPIRADVPRPPASATANGRDPEAVLQAARGFETMFLTQMLRQARDTALAEDPLANDASRQFTAMLDDEHAGAATRSLDLGIARAIAAQLSAAPARSSR
ncbi:rod-binding protein [Plastorhodobacter daqingensis]|uniref:Rod-binding protein n=1 Tax=Plastorhodobacter daqingensis TaxID=1387281 RepID=A0ABW2UK98_9RHOB